jgi:hypothetical protein
VSGTSLAAARTDREFLEQVARWIESRDLIVLRGDTRIAPKGGGSAKPKDEANEPAEAPRPAKRTASASSNGESATFPENLDASAMSATALQAAQDGAPFCDT